jgi:hypothetical protein
MNMALQLREIGQQIPVSVPTAIPIEEVVLKEDGEPGDIWINVRTLVRNCINVLATEDKEKIGAMEVAPVILEEIQLISDFIRQASQDTRRVVYYVTEKKSFARCFPRALPKGYKTPKQLHELRLTTEILLEVIGATDDLIRIFDVKLNGDNRPVLLITHQPIDLLSNYNFPSLKLLESHTGKLKTKTYWNSKLSGKDSGLMPFNALTLQIFGDGESFAAYPRSLKMQLIELAKVRNWSPITTNTKIESDLQTLQDKMGAEMLKGMLRNKPR